MCKPWIRTIHGLLKAWIRVWSALCTDNSWIGQTLLNLWIMQLCTVYASASHLIHNWQAKLDYTTLWSPDTQLLALEPTEINQWHDQLEWASIFQAIYFLKFPFWERVACFCSDRWLDSFMPATPACSNSLLYGIRQYHWIVRSHALCLSFCVLYGLSKQSGLSL